MSGGTCFLPGSHGRKQILSLIRVNPWPSAFSWPVFSSPAQSSLLHAPSKPPPILHRFFVTPSGRFARTPLRRATDRFLPSDTLWHGYLPSRWFRGWFCLLFCAVGFSVGCSLSFHGANQQPMNGARAGVFTFRQSALSRGSHARNIRPTGWAIHPTDAPRLCDL
jgi:hypothetical protein